MRTPLAKRPSTRGTARYNGPARRAAGRWSEDGPAGFVTVGQAVACFVARYRLVPDRSFASIRARSSLHPIHSETDGLEGWLDLRLTRDGALDLRSRPSAHIELPVNRLRSGNPLEERELRRRIDASRYPTIAGDLTAMSESSADGHYVVEGDVTFLGISRPHTDQMTVEQLDGRTLRLSGQSSFDVRDFGLVPPRILLLKVEPIVTVRVTVVAEKEA